MIRTTEEWMDEYKRANALWFHDGNPKRPHAELTSGKHSDGFFNSELVMEDARLLHEAGQDLTELILEREANLLLIDRVVGPAMGAVRMVHDIALHISQLRLKSCFSAYAQNIEGRMIFHKTSVRKGERVILVEDVLTTGGSVAVTAKAVEDVGGIVLPCVAVLVNRSGLKQVDNRDVVALIEKSMPIWEPGDCPLCKEGSEAIRPKGAENWARLNASY